MIAHTPEAMGFASRFRNKSTVSEVSTSVERTESHGEDVARADFHLRRMKDQHRWDPFMDHEKIDAVDSAIASGDPEKEAAVEVSILEEDSPYLEVRSSVSAFRDRWRIDARANSHQGQTDRRREPVCRHHSRLVHWLSHLYNRWRHERSPL